MHFEERVTTDVCNETEAPIIASSYSLLLGRRRKKKESPLQIRERQN